ncbi:MAG: A/G-specific adenine glycosylase [Planctomycetes bacterium]|nr:A/G-specific adenine glycosylase [Planctomycetota bacterium]
MSTAPASFGHRLLRWFDANRRDLPWRRTRDPWAIWVSEVMLQQTRVEAVRDSYERFVRRFAAPADFAAASDDELLAAWRGLGYYRRARLLRDGARRVVAEHSGRVPSDPAALAELPGIGPYTLGALASIAFGHAVVALDGNVERVTARHRGIRTAVRSSPARERVRASVAGWLDRDRPGDFNQALMELGAMVCTPASPGCDRCPVAGDCVAHAAGLTGELPVKAPRRAAVDVQARVAFAARGAEVLGVRVPAGEPNAGQIELPGAGVLVDTGEPELAAALRRRFAARVEIGAELARVRHAITHHRIVLHAHAATVRERGRLQWFPLDEPTPWSTPARKVFRQILGADGTGGAMRA